MSSLGRRPSGLAGLGPRTEVRRARRVPVVLAAWDAAELHPLRGPPGRAVPAATYLAAGRALVEIEVAGRLLLEPETVVLRRLLEEVRRVLEHVAVGALRAGLIAL
jgi:hypothetical protein